MGSSKSLESLREDWQKALLFTHLLFLLGTVALKVLGHYVLSNPVSFTYVEKSYLKSLLGGYGHLIGGAIILLPLLIKPKHAYEGFYKHGVIALWSLAEFHLSFSIGFDTSPFGVGFIIIWSVTALFLFGKSSLKTVSLAAIAIMVVYGIYEGYEIYPYAPLIYKAPFNNEGDLAHSW